MRLSFLQSDTIKKFLNNTPAMIGFFIVASVIIMAIFAPWLTPYPDHSKEMVDFLNASRPPSSEYWFGTDVVGRDVFSRIIFGYRISLVMGVIVLAIVTPIGVILGLTAGYMGGWIESIIMRITDIFLSIPPLVLALAIMGFLDPTFTNAMIAVSAMWWPWYTRLVYSMTRSVKQEGFVIASEIIGAPLRHILLKDILPNCAGAILTKMTLDLGFVIIIGASLSFLGLGVQPPTPDLGSMVSEGIEYLPDLWWQSCFSGLAILYVVIGFNLLGDGLHDIMEIKKQ